MTDDLVLAELRALRDRVPHLRGGLVATCDGFLVAADLPEGVEPDHVAALTATELSLSNRFADIVCEGDFQEVVIRCTGGHLAIYACGPRAALALLTGPEALIGHLHLEARPTALAIAGAMAAATPA
ncbi:roadblock/LC7 domain-containing protein [Actinocorallia longicatena]|uniref:Roadblock/LAMTOR2 domain-containing protein n=1 Tax=Actinocorallia longicatena TaxID=111803 RepID=A0ABP6Q0I4_9ACTN